MELPLDTLYEAIKLGGPASLALFAIYAWHVERKENKEKDATIIVLTEKLLGLATAQVESSTENHAAIIALKDAVKDWHNQMLADRKT